MFVRVRVGLFGECEGTHCTANYDGGSGRKAGQNLDSDGVCTCAYLCMCVIVRVRLWVGGC